MAHSLHMRIGVVTLPIVLAFCPLTAADEADEFRSIPGAWEPMGDSVEPDGIVAVFGDERAHRPALAIQPLTGRPAAAVHRHGTLWLVGIDYYGNLVRIAPGNTDRQHLVQVEESGWDYSALAFDSNHEEFYASGQYGIYEHVVRIDVSTGEAEVVFNTGPYLLKGLAFDAGDNGLWGARSGSSTISLYKLLPATGQDLFIASAALPLEELDDLSSLAFDNVNRKLYGVLEGDTYGAQLASIDPLSAEITLIGGPWALEYSCHGLAFDETTGLLYGTGIGGQQLLVIDPGTGSLYPVGTTFATGLRGLTMVNRHQDCLFLSEYDGSSWQAALIDNEQDGGFIEGCMTQAVLAGTSEPSPGSIHGTSLVYDVSGDEQMPLVAWSQQVDGLYSEILVARQVGGEFVALGSDAFGTPSNRLPGISRTMRESTDPVIVLDATGNPVVAWLEATSAEQYEVYVRRYDPAEDQWLEMGDFSASASGVSASGGTAHSFDMATYLGQVVLTHVHDGYIVMKYWHEGLEMWTEFSPESADPGAGSVSGEGGGADRQPALGVYPQTDHLFITWVRGDGTVLGRRWDGSAWDGIETIHTAPRVERPTATVTKLGETVAAWQEEETTPWTQVLAKYRDGVLWSDIGPGSSSSGGISASTVPSLAPQLAVVPEGNPVIAWEEDGRAFVRKFSPSIDPDCNRNGRADWLDVWLGESPDCNGNEVPDECEFCDGDDDGDVDGLDTEMMHFCLSGPSATPPLGCEVIDATCDEVIDLRDLAMLQRAFTGGL